MCTPQGIIGQLGDQLGGLAFCEAVKAGKYVLHYEKNLGKLQDEIKHLDDRRECIKIKVREAVDGGEEIMPDVKTWQTKADSMKTDVDQLIRQSAAKGNMHCIACSCPNIKWRYRLSKQAEQKILDVKELTEKGHFDEISHCRPPPQELEFPSDENYVNLNSRKPIFNNIVDALKDSSVNTIGVHGPGGVGKTTLVMEVGKKMGHDGYFKQVSLATIPKGRKVEEIQSQLADGLNFNFDPTKGSRKVQLWNKLTNGDKYLIILDDIWEKVDFKAIGIPITNEKRSCKILLTSRNRDLLLITMEVHKNFSIVELPETEAWDLFKKKVGNSFESQLELTTIGHKVCNKCKGLPVAINAIGEALKDKPDFAWNDALVKLERYGLMKIEGIDSSVGASLRLSYDLLGSSNAKSCFLLCCLFPEDAEISVGDLTRHCLARRLLSENPRTLEEVRNSVHTVIDALKSASLLSKGSHENVVKIHDIIRDVGISIAREEKAFFVELGARQWPEDPTYSAISLIFGKIEALPTELTCPKLHTLMFENSELSDLEIPDEFFGGMTQLSVLILTRMRMWKLPSSLRKLANLRMLYLIECDLDDLDILGDLNKNLEVLSLRGSSIEVLPPKIGQLTSLQVLDLEECDELNVIPQGVVSNLTNLEELYFPDTFQEWEATTGEKQDTMSNSNVSLEELRRSLTRGQLIVLHIHIPDFMLLPKEGLKFENLKRFKVSVGSKFKYNEDFPGTRVLKHEGISLRNEFIPLVHKAEVLCLSGLAGLKKVLHDSGVRNGFLDLKYFKVTSCDDDLEYLLREPKSSLQSLAQNPLQSFNKLTVLLIESCKLKYLFSPTTARGLVHLEQLEVIFCEIMQGIVGFEGQHDVNEHTSEVKFGKLKQLVLINLPNLISFYAKKEKIQTTIGSSSARPQPLFNEKVIFPLLEKLTLRRLDNIIEIWDKQSITVFQEQGSFCQLMDVNVDDCAQLTYVFPSKMHALLKNLKELEVMSCGTMKEIIDFEGEIDEDGLKNELCFSKLSILNLSHLPNLVSLCTELRTEGTTKGNATILAQPFFNGKVAFPALEYLYIHFLLNISEIWDEKSLLEETQSFSKLRVISIKVCNQLVYVLPSYMLPQLQNLQKLEISYCEEVEVIVLKELEEKEATENDIIVFHQLKEMTFRGLPKLKSFYSETELIFFQLFFDKVAFPSLENLEIVDLPEIEAIWDNQPLPEPGKEPESFYKLLSIRVRNCHQLVYVLPSYMLPQLQQLEELMIRECDNLEVIVLEVEKLTRNDINVFPQLKALHLWNLPDLNSFFSETQLSDEILQDAFPVLVDIELDGRLKSLLNETSTKEECGTSGKENDDNGEED